MNAISLDDPFGSNTDIFSKPSLQCATINGGYSRELLDTTNAGINSDPLDKITQQYKCGTWGEQERSQMRFSCKNSVFKRATRKHAQRQWLLDGPQYRRKRYNAI